MFYRLSRLLRATGRDLVTLWFAIRHPGTPGGLKLAAVLLGLYALSPIDLLPDGIPLLGLVDDVTLLAFGVPALLKLLPQPALQEARNATERVMSRWSFRRARN
ncbi:Uncharacterized membrane protein YkvA, DUF1232 family [Noviherbaspirillum humi]|uniref:Uncharacterized membrane protein YkvA, DUF1232 family n=1 Tax=Noviherbaspirillum humi TaxID=1688639 RepID=A0A239DY53_9BURK|nr:YkvA family protein [Noviherbaspirillum humi]SNS36653.1 Uncharacterized membrane protein YkvA, DUF1232 family [Noviherbaspirillum humi]